MKSFYKIELSELDAKVISIEKHNDYLKVVFDDTIFYPGGGGQPCDLGKITDPNFEGEVVEVSGMEPITHKIKPLKGELKEKDQVKMLLDTKRRQALMRAHTGEHIFFKSLQTIVPEIKLEKNRFDVEESKIYVTGAYLEWEQVIEAESLANKIIDENRTITESDYSKEEAMKIADLRIKPERIPGDIVRVVRIKDFDIAACKGVHFHSSGGVGNFVVTALGRSSNNYEINFKTNENLFQYVKIARQAAKIMGTSSNELPKLIESMKDELAKMKEKYRKLATEKAKQVHEEKINDITFIWNIIEGADKRMLTETAGKFCIDGKIVCLIDSEVNFVILMAGKDSKINAVPILNSALAHFEGKGGGRDKLAMGTFKGNPEDFLVVLRKKLAEN